MAFETTFEFWCRRAVDAAGGVQAGAEPERGRGAGALHPQAGHGGEGVCCALYFYPLTSKLTPQDAEFLVDLEAIVSVALYRCPSHVASPLAGGI